MSQDITAAQKVAAQQASTEQPTASERKLLQAGIMSIDSDRGFEAEELDRKVGNGKKMVDLLIEDSEEDLAVFNEMVASSSK